MYLLVCFLGLTFFVVWTVQVLCVGGGVCFSVFTWVILLGGFWGDWWVWRPTS